MIYIKPDKTFLEFAKENNYTVFVRIEDTGTIYDGKAMVGIVNKSAYVPNLRPNFYNETGLYVVTLAAQWREYPTKNLGNAIFMGLKGKNSLLPIKIPPSKPLIPAQEMYEHPKDKKHKKCKNLTTAQVGWILTGFVVVFGVLLWVSVSKR
jgi:hypothetical protein